MISFLRALLLFSLLIFSSCQNLLAASSANRICIVQNVPCCDGTSSYEPENGKGFWLKNGQEIIIDETENSIIFNNELPSTVSTASIIKKDTAIAGGTVLRLVFQNSYLTGLIQITNVRGVDYSHTLIMSGSDTNGEIARLSCQRF